MTFIKPFQSKLQHTWIAVAVAQLSWLKILKKTAFLIFIFIYLFFPEWEYLLDEEADVICVAHELLSYNLFYEKNENR